MKHLSFVLAVVLGIALTTGAARAEGARTPTEHAFGIAPTVDVAVTALAPPSSAHPWGTVAVAWDETPSLGGSSRLRVGEWDLSAGRFVHVETLRTRAGLTSPLVRMVRVGDSLYVADAGFTSEGRSELLRIDLALHEADHLDLGDGILPSLAVSDRFLAFGTYERGAFKDGSPFHLRLVDLASFTIVAARRFEQPLSPWLLPRFSTHALRFEGGNLLVILAERQNPKIVQLTLPALASAASVVVPIPNERRWGLTSAAFLDAHAPPAIDVHNWGCARLSASFRLATTPCATLPTDSPAEPSFGEQVSERFYGHTVITGVRRDPNEADKDESDQTNAKWVIRVSP